MPHSFKARPTTDFAQENLFNVLSNYMDFEDGIRALDLFAGTGSIRDVYKRQGYEEHAVDSLGKYAEYRYYNHDASVSLRFIREKMCIRDRFDSLLAEF